MSSFSDTFDANLYLSAGFHIRALLFPGGTQCRYIIDQMKRLINYLDTLKFTYPRPELETMLKEMEDLKRTEGEETKPDQEQSIRLHAIVKCVDSTVRQGALARRLSPLQESTYRENYSEFTPAESANHKSDVSVQ